jgi:hypothetical protein
MISNMDGGAFMPTYEKSIVAGCGLKPTFGEKTNKKSQNFFDDFRRKKVTTPQTKSKYVLNEQISDHASNFSAFVSPQKFSNILFVLFELLSRKKLLLFCEGNPKSSA